MGVHLAIAAFNEKALSSCVAYPMETASTLTAIKMSPNGQGGGIRTHVMLDPKSSGKPDSPTP